MRLTRTVIFVYIAVHISLAARCDEDLEQQLAVAVDSSKYTVQLASFIPSDDLPASDTLQIAFVSTRLCGKGFVDVNGQVNRALLQDVTELTSFKTSSYYYLGVTKATAALLAPVYYINGTGAATGSNLQSSRLNLSLSECVDLELTLSAFRAAFFVDFGTVDQLWSLYAQQKLQSAEQNVTCYDTLNLTVAPAAAPYLKQLGAHLAPSTSFNFTLQVFSSVELCCSTLEQSLVLSVMADLLANATNLITLRINSVISYDSIMSESYPNSANFSFTASSSTYSPVPSLSVALQEVTRYGTNSLFTQLMANESVDAVATAADIRPFPGDSFSDQVLGYTATSSTPSKPPIGLPVGCAIGGAFFLAATAVLIVYAHRQRKQNKLHKAKLAEAAQAKAEYHHSSSSTNSSSSPELTSVPVGQWAPADGVAAQPWDLDPAEITISKRPDGSDWVLGVGSFGQVVKGLRGGVQDVALKMLIGETRYQVNSFRQEVEILKSLSFDRSIVQFYGTCPWQGKTMLVLEHMEGGDLRQALTQAPAQLHWYNQGASVALDIIKGLHFLHKHKVVHMDMKPKNVLLTADYSIAKIADVGLAHIMGGSTPGSPAMGTFAYAAPEQLISQHCDEKVDIYSFGVLLWELVTATPPIRGRLRPIKAPAECPQEIGDLIDRCLSMEPHLRPSARDVFDVISRVQAAQDQLATGDPWDAKEGPPLFAHQKAGSASV